MHQHPTPAHLKDKKQKTVFYLYFGKKHWYIYHVIGRENPYIYGEPTELFYVDEITPLIGSNNSRLRNEHPFIVSIIDTFSTVEKAERELVRRVWEK
jgi:hypothetical protein